MLVGGGVLKQQQQMAGGDSNGSSNGTPTKRVSFMTDHVRQNEEEEDVDPADAVSSAIDESLASVEERFASTSDMEFGRDESRKSSTREDPNVSRQTICNHRFRY